MAEHRATDGITNGINSRNRCLQLVTDGNAAVLIQFYSYLIQPGLGGIGLALGDEHLFDLDGLLVAPDENSLIALFQFADGFKGILQKQFDSLFPERLGDALTRVLIFVRKNAALFGGQIHPGSKYAESIGNFHCHWRGPYDQHIRRDLLQIHELIRRHGCFF